MRKIATLIVVAGGALALAACGAKTEDAPAEPAAEEMMMPEGETPAPAEDAMAAETPAADATAAEEELDPTGNPIGPSAATR